MKRKCFFHFLEFVRLFQKKFPHVITPLFLLFGYGNRLYIVVYVGNTLCEGLLFWDFLRLFKGFYHLSGIVFKLLSQIQKIILRQFGQRSVQS